jgi:hypothetical protein
MSTPVYVFSYHCDYDSNRTTTAVPLNISKDTIKALLAPAKDVIAILDVVSQIHPAVQVMVFQHLNRPMTDEK